MRTEFFLITKDLKTNWKMFALLVLAISVGSTTFMVYMGTMKWWERTMIDRTVNIVSGHLIVEPGEDEDYITNVKSVEKKLNLMPGALGESPRINSEGIVIRKTEDERCSILGIIPSKENRVTIISAKIKEGSFITDNDRKSIILGDNLAEKLNAKVGDKVQVIFKNGVERDYKIKGLVHTDLDFIDSGMLILNLDELRDVLGLGDDATEIAIRVTDPEEVDKMKYLVMQQNVHGKVKTWIDKVEFVRALMEQYYLVSLIVGGITLFAASIAVVVMMYITVINRTHEIGILKAIGGRNSFILYVFLGEAILIGILGVIFGNIFGFSVIQYLIFHPMYDPVYGYFSAVYSVNVALTSSLVTFLTCIIAGTYPAIKASRINIIDAIRGLER
ncbi:MAG: ABC transporter permease [Candidatus Hydrothermarchaeota archaeon]